MRSFIAFTKKELMEFNRSYKLLILFIIFLLLGFMNPPMAKFMPEIISEFMPGGMEIVIPEPTVLDSWTQFFKNVPQMGLIAVVIMLSGIMANEFSKGTLINMLTKGMSRKTVIISKFTNAGLIWTICYFVSFLITWGYNRLFWEATQIDQLIFSVTCVWLFGLFMIGCLILGGVLFKTSYGGLLFAGIILIVMIVINLLETIARYSPMRLVSVNVALLTGEVKSTEVYQAVGITGGAIILTLILSMIVFHKKKL